MSNFNNFSNQPFRYGLEKGSKKHVCPSCNKRTFVKYVDTETGKYLPPQYGRCDRESKCSYHLNPYTSGYAKAVLNENKERPFIDNKKQDQLSFISKPQGTPETIYFDFETFKQTLQVDRYEQNSFIQNLLYNVRYPFDVKDVTKAIELYRIGTVVNGYMASGVTFPFIDEKGKVRAVQVKQFDKQNHTTGTGFLHSIIKNDYKRGGNTVPEWLESYDKQDGKVTCLFGEHLLSKYPSNPIALVEAPKTAIYATLYFGLPETPQDLVWLAVYNKSSFSFDKLKALEGRFVYVFPDLSKDGGTFNEWEQKAKEYERQLLNTRFVFSTLLEQLAIDEDKGKGYDIADYLIKHDWRRFRKGNIQEQQTPSSDTGKVTKVIKVTPETNLFFSVSVTHDSDPDTEAESGRRWINELTDLITFFEPLPLPTSSIRLNNYSTITDCRAYVQSQLDTIKNARKERIARPAINRLRELRTWLNGANIV